MNLAKTIKVQIIKPLDIDWKFFGDILRDFQYETWKLKNKVIQLAWEWNNFQSDYKNKFDIYPKDKELFGKTFKAHVYNVLKDDYLNWSSSMFDQTIKVAYDRFNNDKKEVMRGNKSVASFKKNGPVELRNTNVKIGEDESGIYANLSLLSKGYAKEIGRSGQIPVALFCRDNSTKTILRRMINGEYKLGASKIVRQGNKLFLNISYTFESYSDQVPKKDEVMGIDLGVINAAYIAFNKDFARYQIEGGEITEFRRRVEKRRLQLLKQGKYCGEGRKGHGRVTKLKPISTLSQKVSNFRDTTNHKYSRYITDLAVKHGVSTIQMEDLTGINNRAKFLANWSYYDLQEKITYKAKEHGIEVIKISPKYTSQRCHKCGYINADNRKDQATFDCASCDNKCNADYNAAKNIATPGIEEIISSAIKQAN